VSIFALPYLIHHASIPSHYRIIWLLCVSTHACQNCHCKLVRRLKYSIIVLMHMYPTVCTPTKFCASSSVWQYGSMEFSSLTRAFYHLQFLVSKLGLVTVAAHPCNYSTTTPSQYRLNPNVRLNKRFYSMPTFTFSLSKEGLFIIQLSVLMSDTVCCT